MTELAANLSDLNLPELNDKSRYYGTGRRKSCSARVFLRKGTGKIKVNGKEIQDYFTRATAQMVVKQPLEALELSEKFDVYVTVSGSGIMGQAGAIRHGLTRALINYSDAFKKMLKDLGFVTRDARKVERKKPGRRKARKSEQYSKR